MAIGGWLAWQMTRRLARLPRVGDVVARRGPAVVAGAQFVLALLPFVVPMFDPQPHAINPLHSVVLQGDVASVLGERTNVTGHLAEAAVTIDPKKLPIEATVAGTPPTIVADRVVNLDSAPKEERGAPWPLAIPPLLLGLLVWIGGRTGYPVYRESFEVDVLVTPLAPGERVPAAYGGRVGSNSADLSDPAAVLLMVRRGPTGNVLTAQPLSDSGPAPAPVPIGGRWTSGRTGYVYTVTETVPAMTVRAEAVEATLLNASISERDRVAALVAVGR